MSATPSWVLDHPVLSDWTGPSRGHPLNSDDVPEQALVSFETLIMTVAEAAPMRWEGRRRDFRRPNNDTNLWAARVELVVAGALIQTGAHIEFRDRPDIVVAGEMGLEVTTRQTHPTKHLGAGHGLA